MGAAGVRFDVLVWQAVPWPALLDDVRYLEEAGIGTVWLADHYAWVPTPTDPVMETWTTLAALAAQTTRLRLGSLISNVAMRHPALLAKQAATVDCVSGGRLDLGLGSGYFEREHAWLGVPFLTPGGRAERLREAVEVIDRLLRDRHLTYHGRFYQLDDAPLVPPPVQQPRPPLIIAGMGKKALRVVAQFADTWVWEGGGLDGVEHPLAEIRARNRLLDEYCETIGREPGTIERAYYAGWAKGEAPFLSRDAFAEFVGQYQEAGVQRFVFTWNIAGIFEQAVAAGVVVGRQALDSFVAQALTDAVGTSAKGT